MLGPEPQALNWFLYLMGEREGKQMVVCERVVGCETSAISPTVENTIEIISLDNKLHNTDV